MIPYIHPKQTIFIAGAHGMVGSAITRCLKLNGYKHLLTPRRPDLDFTDQQAVRGFLQLHRPDVVVISAAKVGGIHANQTFPADFLYDNLIIECNLIHESHLANVPRLLFLGSTCIYPKFAPQPIPEEALLAGPLETSNEAYAIAKIAGVKLCQYYMQQYGRSYIAAMPTNLYGPGDNYHPEYSHVIPGLLRRFHEAKEKNLKEVIMWGTGNVKREFLHVDDLAMACLFLLERYESPLHINVGSHEEITIRELANKIATTVGFQGEIVNDLTKPDGTPRKKTDLKRITELGWQPAISLQNGLKEAYQEFLKHLQTDTLRQK